MQKITQKIVDFSVAAAGDAAVEQQPSAAPLVDVDPATVRIESRPEGSLEAVSEKIVYATQEGKQKVYVLVSFVKVEGVIDGQPVTIERPIEFFHPIGQGTADHQWISATMRSLSLAARGGYCAQNLQDLKKVTWDKGPVRLGANEWGKPLYHDSEVAAIAYALQKVLQKRGFLDDEGNQVPSRVLAKKQHAQELELVPEVDPEQVAPVEGEPAMEQSMHGVVGSCPECGDHLRLRDGCPSCSTCGFSRC